MSEYRTTAADRSNRITAQTIARINGIDPTQKERVKRELARLQKQQVDEINQLLVSVGITDKVDSIDNVNFLFNNLGLSGGRKSRKSRKTKTIRKRK